jgi:translation elongation factor EF-Tu-like GTPase
MEGDAGEMGEQAIHEVDRCDGFLHVRVPERALDKPFPDGGGRYVFSMRRAAERWRDGSQLRRGRLKSGKKSSWWASSPTQKTVSDGQLRCSGSFWMKARPGRTTWVLLYDGGLKREDVERGQVMAIGTSERSRRTRRFKAESVIF